MRRLLLLALFGGLWLVGCGPGVPPPAPLPELIPVSGVIKLDGKPLDSATVIFIPKGNEGYSPIGLTNAEGKYTLQTASGQEVHPGAPAGDYQVLVSRMVKPDGSVLPRDPAKPPAMSGARQSIAAEFSLPGTANKQKATVSKTSQTFDFEVSLMRGAGGPGGAPRP